MTISPGAIPDSHVADAFALEGDGVIDLVRIDLRSNPPVSLFLTPFQRVRYLDETWESHPFNITENAFNSTGEFSRPKLSLTNPNGYFSSLVEKGIVEGSIITRYRVMRGDLVGNVRAYIRQLWIASKIINLNQSVLVIEMRSPSDGQNFMLPARSFYPPEFPNVSLR